MTAGSPDPLFAALGASGTGPHDPALSFGDWMKSRMFDQRTVLINGELDPVLATAAAAELMTLDAQGDDLITVHLDCRGGSLEAAFTLIDVVELVGAPLHAVVVGHVAGPAVGILAVADRRLALPHSHVHLTEPTSSFAGRPADLSGWAEQYQRLVDRFVARLARAVHRGEAEVAADLRAGRHLDADEARQYGLVDAVVTGQAEVRRLPGRGFGFQV